MGLARVVGKRGRDGGRMPRVPRVRTHHDASLRVRREVFAEDCGAQRVV